MENNTTTKVVYDPDMPSNELDNITFKKDKFLKSLIRLIICSVIGILVFFVSVPHNGDSEIIFSIVYIWLIGLMGNFAYWVIALIVGGNLFAHIYYKYIKKGKCTSTFAGVYENDTILHTILYS